MHILDKILPLNIAFGNIYSQKSNKHKKEALFGTKIKIYLLSILTKELEIKFNNFQVICF